jgi:DNA-binding IclR family transcriptional regulator
MCPGDPADAAAEQEKPKGGIRSMNSVLSTLRIFEEVAVRQPVGVSELSRATGIPKSSVQRCLTMRALVLGLRSTGEQDLRELAGPVIKRLASETNETVLLGLRDGDDYLIVAREDSTQLIRVVMDVGTRVPLRASSAGISIIARLEPAEIDRLLESELTTFAGTRLPTSDELREEIARTAERGYALDMSSWYRPHVASLGAAIAGATGRPIAAVTLAVPDMRYDHSRETEFARLVVAAADEISRLVSSA